MKAERSIIVEGKLYRRGEELPEPERTPEPEPDLEPVELPPLPGKKK